MRRLTLDRLEETPEASLDAGEDGMSMESSFSSISL